MRFAMLVEGVPVYAPTPIVVGHTWVGNPPGDVYTAMGCLPVSDTALPQEPPALGFRWEPSWTQEDRILQTWLQVPISPDEELSGEEALNILLGGKPE